MPPPFFLWADSVRLGGFESEAKGAGNGLATDNCSALGGTRDATTNFAFKELLIMVSFCVRILRMCSRAFF